MGGVIVKVPFCTCADHECPCNPVNHEEGCVLCVEKCLSEREIPACFYRAITPEMSREQDYTFEGFANYVLKHLGK
jgi:hypothetical protein